jgi:putative DNA primase/helicase
MADIDDNIITLTFAPANDIVTEDSAALKFVAEHGDTLRFCHSRGRWLHWNGQYWEVNHTRLAYHWARELVRQLAGDQSQASRAKLETTRFANGVEKFASCDPAVAREMTDFDRNPWLLGTPGGTIDLRTGMLRPGLCWTTRSARRPWWRQRRAAVRCG